jgi:hypothetical protein
MSLLLSSRKGWLPMRDALHNLSKPKAFLGTLISNEPRGC